MVRHQGAPFRILGPSLGTVRGAPQSRQSRPGSRALDPGHWPTGGELLSGFPAFPPLPDARFEDVCRVSGQGEGKWGLGEERWGLLVF